MQERLIGGFIYKRLKYAVLEIDVFVLLIEGQYFLS